MDMKHGSKNDKKKHKKKKIDKTFEGLCVYMCEEQPEIEITIH